jgi:hypothetical protein
MFKASLVIACGLLLLSSSCSIFAQGKSGSPEIGAYYYNGWTPKPNSALTDSLLHGFPEREPIWGWETSTPSVVKAQIDLAANAGLSFFSFCWYYPSRDPVHFETSPLNQALNLYLKAPNRDRLKFCLLVCNHPGSIIQPKDWSTVSSFWLKMFKDDQYLRVDGKPLLIFFSLPSLLQQFGSPENVHKAFDSLREACKAENIAGVTLGICASSDNASLLQVKQCGFDILTGYNYHGAGFSGKDTVIPIENLIRGNIKVWNSFQKSPLPYIPAITLNWDPRPWANNSPSYKSSPRYTGYSSKSVGESLEAAENWIAANPSHTPSERIILLYAWNEYGEGAWLTPSKAQDSDLLSGLKKSIK